MYIQQNSDFAQPLNCNRNLDELQKAIVTPTVISTVIFNS